MSRRARSGPGVAEAHPAHAGPDGAFLIAAGPGTGKTHTMVERFTWLVGEHRVPVDSILAVTFTERAAAELRERVTAALGRVEAMEGAWIGTFHGVCARLLRENAYVVGVPRELRVLDEVGQRLLIDDLRARLRSGEAGAVDLESLNELGADEVSDLLRNGLGFALKLKGRGIGPAEFKARAGELHQAYWAGRSGQPPAAAEAEAVGVLHAVYEAYEQHLRAASLMDFDDLILRVIRGLQEVPEFAAWCRRRFEYILVDEFQDSNRIQLELIRRLAAPGFGNVAVVGDAKQSIYGWRDAEIENIRSRFPGQRLPLTLNRRSRQEILDFATAFVRLDPEFGEEPGLVAERGSGGAGAVTVAMAADSRREARLIASEIVRLHEAGHLYSEIAVLAHSVRYLPSEFEEELRGHGIPYVTSGGAGFFDREEVKDVVALLRLAADPMDDGALARVLQGPVVRLDDQAMYSLAIRRLGRRGMRLRDCWTEAAAEGFPEVPAPVLERAQAVLGVADRLARARDALTVADVLNRLLDESGYLRHAHLRALREGPRGLLNLRKVFRMASRFERNSPLAGIADFVAHLDRMVEAEVAVGEAEAGASEAVQLLTVHAAKGLEFPIVFLVNLRPPRPRDSERLFFDPESMGFVMRYWRGDRHPHFREAEPSGPAIKLAREERRRAVYVALTRARDRLYVSATREEASLAEVESAASDDHFAELLGWARLHPEAATLLEAEQLDLPHLEPVVRERNGHGIAAAVLDRLAAIAAAPTAGQGGSLEEEVELSFSQLHEFEVCPVRYRFRQVWEVPAPPDELLPARARGGPAADLGAAVHEALRAWHVAGGDLVAGFREVAAASALDPESVAAGEEMLAGYFASPLAGAPTLGAEVGFNLRLEGVRVRGVVDRVAATAGGRLLVDYKTNREIDPALQAAYEVQLQLYGLAAQRGLLPGEGSPRLAIFDLRRSRLLDVEPDPDGVAARVKAVASRIAGGDFELGPEHAKRPCWMCAYRPVCPQARG